MWQCSSELNASAFHPFQKLGCPFQRVSRSNPDSHRWWLLHVGPLVAANGPAVRLLPTAQQSPLDRQVTASALPLLNQGAFIRAQLEPVYCSMTWPPTAQQSVAEAQETLSRLRELSLAGGHRGGYNGPGVAVPVFGEELRNLGSMTGDITHGPAIARTVACNALQFAARRRPRFEGR